MKRCKESREAISSESGEGERQGLAVVWKADQTRSWHLAVLPVRGVDVVSKWRGLVSKQGCRLGRQRERKRRGGERKGEREGREKRGRGGEERVCQPLLPASGGQEMKQSCREPMMDGVEGHFLSLQCIHPH